MHAKEGMQEGEEGEEEEESHAGMYNKFVKEKKQWSKK